MNTMIYEEFINMMGMAKKIESSPFKPSVDFEVYSSLLLLLEQDLAEYFDEKYHRQYDILQKRANGDTYEEIGAVYHVTKERIRQIIDKTLKELRDPYHVEVNKNLNHFYSNLCQLGPGEVREFLYWLIPQKHVVLLVVGEEWYRGALQFDKFIHKMQKRKAPIKPREKYARDEDVRNGIKRFLSKHDECHCSFSELADHLVRDYNIKNTYGFARKITWNKVLTNLYDMEYEGIITRLDHNKIILK